MKQITLISLLLGQIFTFNSVNAASKKNQTDTASKYGVVDMQRVILNVKEGKEARARLEKEIKEKESELRTQKQELDKLNKEWEQQSALLSEKARIEKQKNFKKDLLSYVMKR